MTPRKNEEWVTLADGSKSFMETLKTPYTGKDNNIVGFLGISRDITERKMAEEVLAENEMWLNVYFTQSNNAKFFLMLDHPINWEEAEDKETTLKDIFYNLKVNRINPAMLNLYGSTEEEIFEQEIPAGFIGDFHETKDDWMMLMNNSNLSIVSRALRRNGEEIHVSGDYMCLYNDQ